jgi:hypothetical protein
MAESASFKIKERESMEKMIQAYTGMSSKEYAKKILTDFRAERKQDKTA